MLDLIIKNWRLFFCHLNHDNHDTLFLFNTHECEETQIIFLFDSILGFGLVKDFWKWKFLSLKRDLFTKDFQRIHIIKTSLLLKKWDDNNLLYTLKKCSQF
jgi:hypothetical protein